MRIIRGVVIVTVLLFMGCKEHRLPANEFIGFDHTGITTRTNIPLYISEHKIQIHLSKDQLGELKNRLTSSSKLTPEKIEDFINLKYNRVVTDKKTFQLVKSFILSHMYYFTKDKIHNDNPAAGSFNINIDGVLKYSIYYKLKDDFFQALEKSLAENKCDQNVIDALKEL